MKLYVKDIVRKPNDTLYTFIYKVLRLGGHYGLQGTVNSTYLDPEFKHWQCDSGKHRSFDDLVFISKTYFKVSDKAVAKVIKKILNERTDLIFVLCGSAKKWVLNRNLTKSGVLKYCAGYNISYQKTNLHEKGIYCFDDIITLMGLTIEDLKV